MRKNIYASLCILIAMTFMACQDELESSNVKAGLPAKLTLSIQVPSANKVVNSRGIYDYESEVTELALFMYEQGGRKVFVDLTGELETATGPTDKGGRTYTLSKDIEGDELSGNYRVYAVANWSSPFCGKKLSDLEKLSEGDLKLAMANSANGVTSLSGTERLPMTYAGEIEIKSLEEAQEGTQLSIKLKRITSHIIFNFKNGTGKNQKFTPTSYTVYNLPNQAYLVNREDNKISSGTVSYSSSSSISVSGSEFEFFMLENVQDNGENTSVADREKWNGDSGASPENKTFSHAPANSTFVVVKGEYSDNDRFGEVSYTIHLGAFANDPTNFTVNRNEKHTYTVTVKGVDNIVTEAVTEKEDQPGGEGTITEISKGSNFVLDAHYETIMLSFPLDDKCSRVTMSIKTPFDNATYELDGTENYANADYQWIHFMKPESTTAFPAYNSNKVVDIVQFAKDLAEYANNKKYEESYPFMIQNDQVYTVAFVDEYFYDGKDWPTFVDQENRVLVFNPAPATSTDGNSTYYDDYIFQISQRSIKTTYAHNANVNAFGIETWNETGKFPSNVYDSYNYNNVGYPSQYKSDGYDNTVAMMNYYYYAEVDFSQVGYFKAPGNNSKDVHVFENLINNIDYGDGKIETEYVYAAPSACLTRNRDENGNGKIEGDELKWYLPALEQYTTIWLGRDRLLEDTRLFADEDFLTLNDDNADEVNLWTSSYGESRVYWPAEGASYDSDKTDNWPFNQPDLGVRCVRNLKDTSGQMYSITDGTSMKEQSVIIVDGASPTSMRATTMIGEYTSGHKERSDDNRLYKAFEVAQTAMNQTVAKDKIEDQLKNGNLCASLYSQEPNASDLGQWRVPNQRELMLMGQYGYLENSSDNTAYASSTFYTGTFRVAPFSYYNSHITLSAEPSGYVIRCVRDYHGTIVRDETQTVENTASSYDSAYISGGTGAGVK